MSISKEKSSQAGSNGNVESIVLPRNTNKAIEAQKVAAERVNNNLASLQPREGFLAKILSKIIRPK